MEFQTPGLRLLTRCYFFLPALVVCGVGAWLASYAGAVLLYFSHALFGWGAFAALRAEDTPGAGRAAVSRLPATVLLLIGFGLVGALLLGVPMALSVNRPGWLSWGLLAICVLIFFGGGIRFWPAPALVFASGSRVLGVGAFERAAGATRLALRLTRGHLQRTLEGAPLFIALGLLIIVPFVLVLAGYEPRSPGYWWIIGILFLLAAPLVHAFLLDEVHQLLQELAPDPAGGGREEEGASDAVKMVQAARRGMVRDMQALHGAGASVDEPMGHLTPLMAAMRAPDNQRGEVVGFLLAAGASLETRDHQGWTPLHHAAVHANKETVSALITAGAPIEAEDNEHLTPLCVACAHGRWSNAGTLIEAGAKVNRKGPAPVHCAAGADGDDPAGVDLLIANGADVSVRGKLGRTALMAAAMSGNAVTARALLKSGADVNAQDDFGNTALMEAARAGANGVLEELSHWNPETEHRDKPGRTALLVAVSSRRSDEDTVRLLLSMGADGTVKNREGRQAGDLAAAGGRWRIARALGIDAPLPAVEKSRTTVPAAADADENRIIDLKVFETEEDRVWAQRQLEDRSRTQLVAAVEVDEPADAAAAAASQPVSDEEPEAVTPQAGAQGSTDAGTRAPSAEREPTGKRLEPTSEEEPGAETPEPSPEEAPEVETAEPSPEEAPEGETAEPSAEEEPDAAVPEPDHEEASDDATHDLIAQEEGFAEELDGDLDAVVEIEFDPQDAVPEQAELPMSIEQQEGEERDDQAAGYQSLLKAAVRDDLEQMELVLDIEDEPPEWWLSSAFLNAVAAGRVVAPLWLLDNGLNANARNASGDSLLMCIAQQSPPNLDILAKLIDQGARVDDAELLHWLAGMADHELGSEAELDLEDERRLTQLMERMIDAGAEPAATDQQGNTPLHWAARYRHPVLIEALIKAGCPVKARNASGATALMLAVTDERTGAARVLVKHGADPKAANEKGNSAMSIAMDRDDKTMLKLLMSSQPAEPDEAPKEADPRALVGAAAAGNLGRVKLLLGRGPDIDIRDEQGCSALLRAAGSGHADVVSALLHAGADTNLASRNRTTPLGAAVLGGHIRVVKLLCDRGVDVDQRQQYGITPLMLASARWEARIVVALLGFDADPDARDETECTPLMAAVQNALQATDIEAGLKTVKLLIKAGADVNAVNDEGQTPLMLLLGVRARVDDDTSEANLIRLARMLIEAGADVDRQDLTGWSALHAAAGHGFRDAAELLLQAGANRRLRDINGLSPMDLAMDNAHDALVDLFLAQG